MLTLINILYHGQGRNQIQESKTVAGVRARKSGMSGLAAGISVVQVRIETTEIRKVKHEAGGAVTTWKGSWERGMQIYRSLPEFLGVHTGAGLSLLNTTEYQPPRDERHSPTARHSPNQNLFSVFHLLPATIGSFLGGKSMRPPFCSRPSGTRRVASGHR